MDDEVDRTLLEPERGRAALSAHAEASMMLEAALEQMDGIIAGNSVGRVVPPSPATRRLHVLNLKSSALL